MYSFARRNARISSSATTVLGVTPVPLLDAKIRPIIQRKSRKLATQKPLRSKQLFLEDEPGLYEEGDEKLDDWESISRSRELFPVTDKLVYPTINDQLLEAGEHLVATNPAIRSALEDVFMQMQREGSLPEGAMESLSIHTGGGTLLIPAPIAGRHEGETESTETGPSLLLEEAQPREPVERKRVTRRSKRALAKAASTVSPGLFMRALNWILNVLNKIPEHLHPMTTAFRSRVSSPRLLEEPRPEPRQDGLASDNDETASQPGAPRTRAVVPIVAATPPASSRSVFTTSLRIAVAAAVSAVALRSFVPSLVSRVSAAWQGATSSVGAPSPVAGPSLSTSLYN